MTVMLYNPAAARAPDEIVLSYPPISRGSIRAAVRHTAESAEELD